ncbi:hypothetical protein [Streptomyces sp. NPDC046821]|uniref:Rv1733c family protein n=1 Tax=Streptomyces sp. NPDC046821 TaxID=3154702 RepID=UPI0033FF58AB
MTRSMPRWRWRWSPVGNPLRRRSDVVQACTSLLVAAVVLIGAPVTSAVTYDDVRDSLRATAAEQTRTGHHITVTLLQDSPKHPYPRSSAAGKARYPVRVRYVAPDGTEEIALADVRASLRAGTSVRVWAGADGKPTDAPLDADGVHGRAVGLAGLSGMAVVLVGVIVHLGVRRALDRRRMAAWDRAWAESAPK